MTPSSDPGYFPAPPPASDAHIAEREGGLPTECERDECRKRVRYKMVRRREGNAGGQAARCEVSYVCREHRGKTYDGYDTERYVAKRYGTVTVPRFTSRRAWWDPRSWFTKQVWDDSREAQEKEVIS